MMGTFRYRAMTADGTILKGVVDAPDEQSAFQSVRRQGHFPISASDAGASSLRALLARAFALNGARSARVVASATAELATLLSAGLELDRAIGILIGLSELKALAQPLIRIRNRVRDGAALADAMDEERLFSAFYISMVRGGETGGALDKTFAKLADYLARSLTVRDAVVSALVYPAILLATSATAIALILIFVLPEFQPLFAQAGRSLPTSARIVMGIGNGLRDYWWAILLAVAGAVAWLRAGLRRPAFRLRFDALLLKLPLFGELVRGRDLERFARAMSTMLSNGLPLPDALELARDTLANTVIAKAIKQATASLREGESLAHLLGVTGLFPPMMLDLIRVGEETGRLDEMLLRQADLDERRLRQTVDRLISLLVPTLTIVLGFMVGGVIASMLSAIFSVNDLALQ